MKKLKIIYNGIYSENLREEFSPYNGKEVWVSDFDSRTHYVKGILKILKSKERFSFKEEGKNVRHIDFKDLEGMLIEEDCFDDE